MNNEFLSKRELKQLEQLYIKAREIFFFEAGEEDSFYFSALGVCFCCRDGRISRVTHYKPAKEKPFFGTKYSRIFLNCLCN